jgi:hypothetical protein
MVMSEVPLSREEELALIVACELRPTLAVGDAPVSSVDCGRVAVIDAALRYLGLRPVEYVAASHLGVHWTGKMQL